MVFALLFCVNSLLGDEWVPLDPKDADPCEVSMDSSQTRLCPKKLWQKKEEPTDLELLDEAIATAAEQTGVREVSARGQLVSLTLK